MSKVRSTYDNLKTEEQIEQFIRLCEETTCSSSEAYKAVATMQLAKHTILPNKQYRYFNEGKDLLEDYIRQNPKDIEARYLRILVQLNVPSYINYRDDYRQDYAFLKKEIGSSSLPDSYQSRILNRIKNELEK